MSPSELDAIPIITDEDLESLDLDYEKMFSCGELTSEVDENFVSWFVSKRLNLRWFDGNPNLRLANAYSCFFEDDGPDAEFPNDATMIGALRAALTRWERGIPIRAALHKDAT